MAEYIEQNMPDDKFSDIYVIKDIAQRLTSERLSFSLKAKESDPNKTFETGEANCIGYAAFTATVANHLIEKMYADNSWKAIPCKGKLYVFGSDIHQYTESRWFKDHDFVIFRNRESDSEIYADPTVSDYMGINEISKYKPEK